MVNVIALHKVHGSDYRAAVLLKALCIKTNLSVKNHSLRFQSTCGKMLGGNFAEAGQIALKFWSSHCNVGLVSAHWGLLLAKPIDTMASIFS